MTLLPEKQAASHATRPDRSVRHAMPSGVLEDLDGVGLPTGPDY
jgi:hypothetical protein